MIDNVQIMVLWRASTELHFLEKKKANPAGLSTLVETDENGNNETTSGGSFDTVDLILFRIAVETERTR